MEPNTRLSENLFICQIWGCWGLELSDLPKIILCKKVGISGPAPLFNACLPILLSPLLLPLLTHRHPGTPGYHSRGARPGRGCSCGNWQGTREPLSLSTSQPWPKPSLPAPTCCQGSPPQEGWSPPHSDPLLWIRPAGIEVWGVGLSPAGLPGKTEKP